jgi:hypothetical protein
MKICNRCKKPKEEEEFPKRSDSGKPGAYCKECQREYDRKYWKKIKERYGQRKLELEKKGK